MNGFSLITTHINESLADAMKYQKGSSVFAGARLYDLAENAERSGSTGSFPVIWKDDGTALYIGAEEIKPMIFYHRLLSITFAPARVSYGDTNQDQMTAFMRLVTFADRSKIGMSGDELGLFLYARLPRILPNVPNFGSVALRVTGIIANAQQAFRNEYERVTYFLKPEHILLNIHYSIESKIKPSCFNNCP